VVRNRFPIKPIFGPNRLFDAPSLLNQDNGDAVRGSHAGYRIGGLRQKKSMSAQSTFPSRALAALVLMLGALCLPSLQAQSPQRARTDLRDFAMGADVSELQTLEDHGAIYRKDGSTDDPLRILNKNGFNWMRLRLLVRPDMIGPLCNNLNYDLELAKRIKAENLHLLLDMFYSDTWADPGNQSTPASWRGLSQDKLVNQLRAYNRRVITEFRTHGAMPDMVEVGNEITNGMLWPDGKVSIAKPDPAQWSRLGELLKASIEGVKEGAAPGPVPLIMIHIDRGGDTASSLAFYHHMVEQGVAFDVIGLSDYPWWQGSLDDLKQNLDALAVTFHKPVVVVETSFPWDPQSFSKDGRTLSPAESVTQVLHFPATPAGQAQYARALVQTVRATPDHLGDGVFYWAAAWIPAHNWGAPEWSEDWERRALFDRQGNALPAMKAFGEAAGHIHAGTR
jgi:arabinogalactan endo-1,4-beta-galactosidase